MSYLLPSLPNESWLQRIAVLTASGLSSRTVAERFGFGSCTSDVDALLRDERVNTVFIATRHDSHARYVTKAVEQGKHVFVEKPLCITVAEQAALTNVLMKEESRSKILMVGFNRRFSPLVSFMRQRLGPGPMSMIYRVNAGALPADSWILDHDRSGGRIVGEACHFIDLLTFLNGSRPTQVQAFGFPDPRAQQDTSVINLTFENGSIGTIAYLANGAKNLPKEYVEVHKAGITAILRDFKEVEILDGTTTSKKRLAFQDKGQSAMVHAFLRAVKDGEASPIPLEDILAVTAASFAAVDSRGAMSVVSI
jgi:predicted dehydrogenase